MTIYTRTICKTINKETNKTNYFMQSLGSLTRISKEDYFNRKERAIKQDWLLTKSDKTHIRHYVTCHYEY